MSSATRFVIEQEPVATAARKTTTASPVRQAASVFPWVELAFFLPSKLLTAVGWLAFPLFVFAVVPVVLLGTLVLAQAPIFFLLWKVLGPRPSEADHAGDAFRGEYNRAG